MNKIFYTWQEIENAIDYITSRIKSKRIQIDVVYGVPRGGLILAVLLSHRLNVPLILDPFLTKDKRILVIDDISDSGTTLMNLISKMTPSKFSHPPVTATIHYKPGSLFIPDIYYSTTSNWVVYAWETESTSKADYIKV